MKLPSMTDAEYKKQRRRVRRLSKKWVAALGMDRSWKIDLRYHRAGLKATSEDEAENFELVMTCNVRWQYLTATINVNMLAIVDQSDAALEDAFVHELCHVFVNEMRDEWTIEHEERVTTQLCNAFIWLRDDLKKRKKKRG